MDLSSSAADQISRRTAVISRHLRLPASVVATSLEPSACLSYTPPEAAEAFDPRELRRLLDGHDVEARDWLFRMMEGSAAFRPRERGGGRVFVAPDYNETMEQQREVTMRRIEYLLGRGVFDGWMTRSGEESEMRRFALNECIGIYDHSLAIKLGVHFFLW